MQKAEKKTGADIRPRYYFEIAEDLATCYCFAYVDTVDDLASFLFAHLHVDEERELEVHYDDDPFKIVMCHIPRQQREAFLEAVGLLPELMAYAGKEGYDDYCLALTLKAANFLARQKDGGRLTPLQ